MKILVTGGVTVALVAATALALFAVYTWGWHQSTGGSDRERALTYARTVSFTQKWELIDVEKDAPFWVARYTNQEGASTCVAIDVKQFTSAGNDVPLGFRGVYQIHCRPATP